MNSECQQPCVKCGTSSYGKDYYFHYGHITNLTYKISGGTRTISKTKINGGSFAFICNKCIKNYNNRYKIKFLIIGIICAVIAISYLIHFNQLKNNWTGILILPVIIIAALSLVMFVFSISQYFKSNDEIGSSLLKEEFAEGRLTKTFINQYKEQGVNIILTPNEYWSFINQKSDGLTPEEEQALEATDRREKRL